MQPSDGRVVPRFIVRALNGEPITVYGDGSQTRSFCHVDDLIEGLIRLMATPVDFTGPVNVGDPNDFTILELTKKAIARTGPEIIAEKRDPHFLSPENVVRAHFSSFFSLLNTTSSITCPSNPKIFAGEIGNRPRFSDVAQADPEVIAGKRRLSAFFPGLCGVHLCQSTAPRHTLY